MSVLIVASRDNRESRPSLFALSGRSSFYFVVSFSISEMTGELAPHIA